MQMPNPTIMSSRDFPFLKDIENEDDDEFEIEQELTDEVSQIFPDSSDS